MVTKKVVDTWKTKSWYAVRAPKFLNEVEVAQVIAKDDESLMNRTVIIPLKDVTKDISHTYTNIKLRITEIKGKTAYTKFIAHEVSREFIHAMVRRFNDALHVVFYATSKDGIEFKIKAVAVTGISCSGRQKTLLRNMMVKELKAKAASKDFGQFIYDTLYGKTANEVFKTLKKIVPIKRIEVRKTELTEVFDVQNASEIDKGDQPKTEEEGEEEKPAEETPSASGTH
jgi:small subunit ribosomal protein S3Ae